MDKNTVDFDNAHYSPELIRQYEDPEYAKAAAEYERQARAERAAKAKAQEQVKEAEQAQSSGQGYSYDDYLAARDQAPQKPETNDRIDRTQVYSGQQMQQGYAQAGTGGQDSRKPSAVPAQDPQRIKKEKKASGKLAIRKNAQPVYKPPKHNKPKVRKKRKIFRKILLLIAVLYILLMGYILLIASHMDKVDTSGSDFAIDAQVDSDMKMYRNIAILGSDARKDEGYDGSRTDAIIILSIHRLTGKTKMISVMRDSYLKLGDRNGDLILDKVTHAHAFGGGENTVEALNRSLDLNIREFLIFNWQAVADTVDTVGGIEVDVKKKEISDMNTWGPETGRNVGKKYHKIKKAGVQTLDGVQATTYCRIRKTSGGDSGRAERYKKVLAGVMKKTATSPGNISSLSEDVMPQIRTNMNSVQIATLANRMPFLKMEKGVSWPKKYYGGLVDGVWYAVPRTLSSNVKRLHRQAFEQDGYALSPTCKEINDEIIAVTGVE